MHASGKKKPEDIPALSTVHGTNRDHWPLVEIVKTFTRPMRGYKDRFLLDGFDSAFYIVFDFEDDPETPASAGTCDIGVVSLWALSDPPETVWLVSNANKFGVMRFLAAIGIQRFSDKVKTAFYASSNPLRAQ